MTKNLGTPLIRMSSPAQPCCSMPAPRGAEQESLAARRGRCVAGMGRNRGALGWARGGQRMEPLRCSVGAVAALLPKARRGSGEASAKRHLKKAKCQWLGVGWDQVKGMKDHHLG